MSLGSIFLIAGRITRSGQEDSSRINNNCRGGPLWPPVLEIPRTGGHRAPPLQLFPIEQIRRVIGDAGEWCNNLIDLLLGFGFGTDEESGDDVADAGRDRQ